MLWKIGKFCKQNGTIPIAEFHLSRYPHSPRTPRTMSTLLLSLGLLLLTGITLQGAAASSNVSTRELDPEREARVRLYKDLQASQVLQEYPVPLSQAGPVDVQFMVWLYKMADADEAGQTMSPYVYYMIRWRDADLSWDPQDYANISRACLPSDRAWWPDTIVINTADTNFNFYEEPGNIALSSDGTFEIEGVTVLKTHCLFEMKYFPFDNQTCRIMFGLRGGDVSIIPNASQAYVHEAITDYIDMPSEWSIEEHYIEVAENPGMPLVHYIVRLKRAYMFYVACLLGPMAATSQLALLVFWIPPASGERISFLVSIYVSMTLYIALVGDNVPRKEYSFLSTPRMVLFVAYSSIQCIVVLVATVVSMHWYQAEQDALNDAMRHKDAHRTKSEEEKEALRDPSREEPNVGKGDTKTVRVKSVVDQGLESSFQEPQPWDNDENKPSENHYVGTQGRRGRVMSKLFRFVNGRKQAFQHTVVRQNRRCLSANALDKFLFFFVFSLSSVFYMLIFRV